MPAAGGDRAVGARVARAGRPGPAIGFLQEAMRWWDHWLKGVDTGIMDEPMVRAYMQDSEPPQTAYDTRRGHWVAEADWPTPNVREQVLHVTAHGLAEAQPGLPIGNGSDRQFGGPSLAALAPQPPDGRGGRRIVASLRQSRRSPRRPAAGQRPLAVPHRRAADRAARAAGTAPRPPDHLERPHPGVRRRAAVRRAPGRLGRADQPGDPEPDTRPTATSTPLRSPQARPSPTTSR